MDFFLGVAPLTAVASWVGALAGLVVLAVLALALARPLLLKLALRNVARRPLQSLLIACGLMLATVLLTASLVLGDSTAYSFKLLSIAGVGNLDEAVTRQAASTTNPLYLNADEAAQLERTILAVPQVEATGKAIVATGAVYDLTSGQAHAHNVVLGVGTDFDALWGSLHDMDGGSLRFADLQVGHVFVGRRLAAAVGARPGDALALTIAGRPVTLTVQALMATDIQLTVSGSSPTAGTVVMPLTQLQQTAGQPDAVTTLFVKNRGAGGLADLGPANSSSEAVVGALRAQFARPAASEQLQRLIDQPAIRATLQASAARLNPSNATRQALQRLLAALGQPAASDQFKTLVQAPTVQAQINAALALVDPTQLREAQDLERQLNQYSVQAIKQDLAAQAENLAAQVTTLTLLLNLFAILVGGLLIYLIFTMLAAERRVELGVSRAIGLRRGHLIRLFLFEGLAYSLVGSLLGSGVGVGVGAVLTGLLAPAFRAAEADLNIQPYVEPASLLLSGAAGFLFTALVVSIAAWRLSRLNVVAAMRDLDEQRPSSAGARWAWLAVPAGGLALAAGLLTRLLFGYTLGVALLLGATGLGVRTLLRARRVAPGRAARLAFSLTAGALIFYLAQPFGAVEQLVGLYDLLGLGGLQGGVEVLFLTAVLVVAAAVGLLVYNSDILSAALSRLAGRAARLAAVVRLGLAYPQALRWRTALTIAMFAVVVFVLSFLAVLAAVLGGEWDQPESLLAGWTVAVGSPSFNFTPDLAVPTDLPARVRADRRLAGEIAAVGGENRQVLSLNQVRPAGSAALYLGRRYLHVVDDSYLSATLAAIRPRAQGYASDRAVWDAVAAQPGLAVLANAANTAPGASGSVHLSGIDTAAGSFAPFTLEIIGPAGNRERVAVIGFVDHLDPYWNGLYISERTGQALLGGQSAAPTGYYIRPAPRVAAAQVRHDLSVAFGPRGGLETVDTAEELRQVGQVETILLRMLIIFVGLGLAIGIAAVGVITSRLVVERRQQIGLLRAIGYRVAMLQLVFLVETSFIALAGLAIGAAGGIWGAYVYLSSSYATTSAITPYAFAVPVPILAAILGSVYVAALFTTWLPARAAARLRPSEALRLE